MILAASNAFQNEEWLTSELIYLVCTPYSVRTCNNPSGNLYTNMYVRTEYYVRSSV
jgi:hypothetical protein